MVSGHSFGGITAIEAAFYDERVKHLLTLDPWVWAIYEAINDGSFTIKQPQVHAVTELFVPIVKEHFNYDTTDVLHTLIKNSESAMKELIILNEQNHFHQCDGILASPIEIYLFSGHKWQTNYADLYKLNTMVLLRFMKKLGVADFEAHPVEDWIKSREDQYLTYIEKY